MDLLYKNGEQEKMKTKKIITLGLLFLCLISFIYIPNSFGASQFTTTFPDGEDNLYEGHEYDFSVLYYDENNYSKQFSQAKLETGFEDFGIGENYSLTSLDTMYNYYPSNLTVNEGEYNTEGTPNSLDDDYYNISSSSTNATTPLESEFDFTNGTINSFGDLEEIDSDYTILDPEYNLNASTTNWIINNGSQISTGDLEEIDDDYYLFNSSQTGEEGLYQATYSFTDDDDGENPDGWIIDESGGSTNVISGVGGHTKVVKLYDTSPVSLVSLRNDFTDQSSETIEFWARPYSATITQNIRIEDDSKYDSITMIFNSDGNIKYSDGTWYTIQSYSANTWYHFRIEFDCSTNWHLWIDTISKDGGGGYGFKGSPTAMDSIYFETVSASQSSLSIDAVGYSWDTNYNIGDNLVEYLSDNINITNTFNSEFTPTILSYSLNTSISTDVNISFYNFDTSNWDLYETKTYTSFSLVNFDNFNSSYYNSTNYVSISFEITNSSNFLMYLEVLRLESDKYLNFTTSISLENFTSLSNLNLFYAFNSSVSNIINMSIYNFTSNSYYQIQSSINTTFINTMFELNSHYYNDSNNIFLKFVVFNTTLFQFYLDKLVILSESFLNVSAIIDCLDITDLLEFQILVYYYTSIYQNLNFSIYYYSNPSWILINNTINFDDFYESLYIYNSTGISNFFNGTLIKLQWYGTNITTQFHLYIDFIQAKLYFPLQLEYSLSFDLLGTWRYRWHIETIYTSDWIYFDVVPPEPNIKMISESDKLTEWEFLGTDYTEIDLYESDFSSESWSLYNIDNNYIYDSGIDEDSYVDSRDPSDNFGDLLYAESFSGGGFFIYSYFQYFPSNNYLMENMTSSIFRAFLSTGFLYRDIVIYNCSDIFDEDTINYNNKPDVNTVVGNGVWDYYQYNQIILDDYVQTIRVDSIMSEFSRFDTKESSNDPAIIHRISKIYNGDNYVYIQTNQTETLNIKSQNNLNLNLQEGDKIEISFNTTSSNKIDLNLINSGITQNSYILSRQGNPEFDNRTVYINIDSDITIDQLEFLGLFEETKNLQINNIRIFRINATGTSEYYSVEPQGSQEIYMDFPEDFIVYVYEDNQQVESFNITTSQDLQVLVYEKINTQIVYIILYDSNNEYLNFNNFQIDINYTLQEFEYLNKRLSINQFYVDIETQFDYNIYDSFDALVKSDTDITIETFIDIVLDVYELKIKNEASEYVSYTLENVDTSSEKEGLLLPEEISYYYLASNNYSLQYINNEDSSTNIYDFEFTDNKIIVINSTYFDVYLALFTYDGIGIDRNLLRFYVNGERKDFGFITFTQDINNLKILDYFNNTIKDTTVNLRQWSEYSLFIEIYTLNVINNFNRTVRVQIERSDTDIVFEQTIDSLLSFPYRFIPNIEYEIIILERNNNTVLDKRTVNLTENGQIADFGFYVSRLDTSHLTDLFTNIIIAISLYIAIILIFVGISVVIKRSSDKNKNRWEKDTVSKNRTSVKAGRYGY